MGNLDKIYGKWNKYEIGKIPFINARKAHPHRNVFINFVLKNNIISVVEIGPGEMIEYEEILKHKDIDYTIVDVSQLFLDNCKQKFPSVKIIKSSIEDLEDDTKFNIVYVSSVLEHTRDVCIGIKKIIGLADMFHLAMFKWRYEGDLQSNYVKKKKYWSTSFNIWLLLNEIRKYGEIEYCQLVKQHGEIVDFFEYSQGKSGEHRTGDYLVIHGKRL